MAKLERGGVASTPHRQVGNFSSATYNNDRYVERRRPIRTAPFSSAHQVHMGRFARAVGYVKAALADPVMKTG